jgi:hypothetical protein
MGFHATWLVIAGVLIVAAVLAGFLVKLGAAARKPYAILIDDRERFSLNRLQLVLWTVLILSTFLGLLFTNLDDPSQAMAIPTELLGLLGISLGTGVIAGAVKAGKDTLRSEKIGGGPTFAARRPAGLAAAVALEDPHFGQIVLEEEGAGANKVISVTKFQNLLFTLALAVVYVTLAWKANGYPTFDEQAVWLIGVSHATYVGGKVPNKS